MVKNSSQEVNIDQAGHQIVGARREQEDSFRILRHMYLGDGTVGSLYILCDGMGGHSHGGMASEVLCESFIQAFREGFGEPHQRLNDALVKANRTLAVVSEQKGGLLGMGTTVVVAWVDGLNLWWLSVGDSPMWLLRGTILTRLNEDHSMTPVLKKMVEMGQLSEEDAAADPRKHVLRSAVSGGDIRMIDSPTEPYRLYPEDRLLLASDGVEVLSDDELCGFLQSNEIRTSEERLEKIFAEIEKKAVPTQDNASAILVSVDLVDLDDTVEQNWNGAELRKLGFEDLDDTVKQPPIFPKGEFKLFHSESRQIRGLVLLCGLLLLALLATVWVWAKEEAENTQIIIENHENMASSESRGFL